MFEAVQLPQITVPVVEKKVQYTFVEDATLIHVGGGCTPTAHF